MLLAMCVHLIDMKTLLTNKGNLHRPLYRNKNETTINIVTGPQKQTNIKNTNKQTTTKTTTSNNNK